MGKRYVIAQLADTLVTANDLSSICLFCNKLAVELAKTPATLASTSGEKISVWLMVQDMTISLNPQFQLSLR